MATSTRPVPVVRCCPLAAARNDGAGVVPLSRATRVDLVRVQAKQILALAFEGRLAEAQDELRRFHEGYPHARGVLAGKSQPYSEAVQAAINGVIKAGLASNAEAWPTFAGAVLPQPRADRLSAGRPVAGRANLRLPLPAVDPAKKGKDKAASPPDKQGPVRRTAFHPVIVGRQVLIADAESVASHDLATGKSLFRYDLKTAGLHGSDGVRVPLPGFHLDRRSRPGVRPPGPAAAHPVPRRRRRRTQLPGLSRPGRARQCGPAWRRSGTSRQSLASSSKVPHWSARAGTWP